eukprot:Filipodium_phascolosomae@DN2672_c0_g1_i13.p1
MLTPSPMAYEDILSRLILCLHHELMLYLHIVSVIRPYSTVHPALSDQTVDEDHLVTSYRACLTEIYRFIFSMFEVLCMFLKIPRCPTPRAVQTSDDNQASKSRMFETEDINSQAERGIGRKEFGWCWLIASSVVTLVGSHSAHNACIAALQPMADDLWKTLQQL